MTMKKTKNKLLKATASVRGKSSNNSNSGHGNTKGESSNQQNKKNKMLHSPSGTSLLALGSQEVGEASPKDETPHSPFSFTTFQAKGSSHFNNNSNGNNTNNDGSNHMTNEETLEMIDPNDGIDMFHNSPTKVDNNIATLSFPDEWTGSQNGNDDVLLTSQNEKKPAARNSNSPKNKNTSSRIPPRMKAAKGLFSPISSSKKKQRQASMNADESGAFPTLPTKSTHVVPVTVSDSKKKTSAPPSSSSLSENTQPKNLNKNLTKLDENPNIDDNVQWDPDAPVFSNVGSPQSSEDQQNDAISFSGILGSLDEEDNSKDGQETTNVVWEQRKDWSQDDTTLVKPQQGNNNKVKLQPSKTDNANSEYAKRIRREKKDFLSRSNSSPRKMKLQIQELLEENKTLKKEKKDLEKKLQQKRADGSENNSSINPYSKNPSAHSISATSSPHDEEGVIKISEIISDENVTEAKGDISSKMQQEISKLNKTIILLEDSNKESEQNRLRLERENRSLKEEAEITLVYLQQELSTALQNVEDADLSRSRDQERMQELNAKLIEFQEDAKNYTNIKEEKSRLMEEKQKDEAKVKECTLQLAMANAMIASKTEEVVQNQKELADLQKVKQHETQLLADLKLELDNANKTMEEDSNRNALEKKALRTENEILMKQNKVLENSLNMFKIELNNLKMKDDETEKVDNTSNVSEEGTEQLKSNLRQCEQQLIAKETEIIKVKTEFGKLIEVIEEKLLALENENKKLRENNKSIEKENQTILVTEGVNEVCNEVQFNELRKENLALERENAELKSIKASTILEENPPDKSPITRDKNLKDPSSVSNELESHQNKSEDDHNGNLSSDQTSKTNTKPNDGVEENLHEVFSIPASKSETGERTSEDMMAGTLIHLSATARTSLPVTKQTNRRQTGNKRWQAMSVGITEAQLRAKDLQVENLQRAAKINEETINNLKNDVATVNKKIEENEKAYKEKVDELTKENIACTYKLTVLEKVRRMELDRVGKFSASLYGTTESEKPNSTAKENTDIKNLKSEEKSDEPSISDSSMKPDREESPILSEEKISNESNESEAIVDEIEKVTEERKFSDESMHVLVAKIVALEKEKEASLEKIDSLQSLVDAMYERERNEKEEKMLYIEHLRDEITFRSSEVTSLEKELQSLRNGEKVSGQKITTEPVKIGDGSEHSHQQSIGKKMLPGLLRRINGGSKHGSNSIHSMNNDVASDDPALQKLKRTCRIHEHSIASLTSEINSLRLVLQTETSKHEIEMENMKAEAELSASKVTILEEQFIELNKLQENWLSDLSATGSESKYESKQSIISLDAGYVTGLKDSLAEQKDLVDTLNAQLEETKNESKQLEQTLRNNINSLNQAKSEGEHELRTQILAIVESKKAEEENFQLKIHARESTIATLEKSLKQLRECNQNSIQQRRIHTSSEMGLIVEESSQSVDGDSQTNLCDSHSLVDMSSDLGNENNNETDISKLRAKISQLKQIEEELVTELEEKEEEISKLQRKVSILENQIKDSRITEKSSVLSLRRIGLIQELLDASTRRLNTMMNKLGRDQNKEDNVGVAVENDPKLVLSVADKVSLLQEQLKLSIQFVELKLANELESIRRAKRGEDEDTKTEEVSQAHLQKCIEIQKETTEVLKGTEKTLAKQIEEVNQEMKLFNLALLSKDDVIEGLNNAVCEKTLEIQSIQSKFDVLISSCKDGQVVTDDLFKKVTEGIQANRALQEKERTIQRLNNVINDYRTRLDLLEQDENLQDGNDHNSDDEYFSDTEQKIII